jgi:hypothetical protein
MVVWDNAGKPEKEWHAYDVEEIPMAEQPSPLEARAQLHRIVERLTDEEAVAIWRLVCSWVAEGITEPPVREDSEEHS